MDQHDQIIAWLDDAHAMEQSMQQVLTRHRDAAHDYPEVRERLQQHLDETRSHAARVRECLESLGTQPSVAKAMTGGFMGAIQGMSTGMFRDEIVKNALADYAMEHFEIGCYSALTTATEDAGLQDISRACGEILREETQMALWLEEQIPALTRLFLQQSTAAR